MAGRRPTTSRGRNGHAARNVTRERQRGGAAISRLGTSHWKNGLRPGAEIYVSCIFMRVRGMDYSVNDVIRKFLERAELAGAGFTVPAGPPEWTNSIRGGVAQIGVSPEELIKFTTDPAGWIAKSLGGSKEDYLAWCRDDCGQKCKATNNRGKPCGLTAPVASLTEWVARGRRSICNVHLEYGEK